MATSHTQTFRLQVWHSSHYFTTASPEGLCGSEALSQRRRRAIRREPWDSFVLGNHLQMCPLVHESRRPGCRAAPQPSSSQNAARGPLGGHMPLCPLGESSPVPRGPGGSTSWFLLRFSLTSGPCLQVLLGRGALARGFGCFSSRIRDERKTKLGKLRLSGCPWTPPPSRGAA